MSRFPTSICCFSRLDDLARLTIIEVMKMRRTKWISLWFALTLTTLCPVSILAQQPLTGAEVEAADQEVVDLGRLEVVGQDFSFEQEVQIRLVRQALKNHRSDKREDIDEWVCWYERPTGTRRKHLMCARNGDLWALRPSTMGPPGSGALTQLVNSPSGSSSRGYGTIWRSNTAVQKSKFERNLEQLPGSDDFDKEFLAMASLGYRPPRDVPSDEEFDRYAAAYQELGDLQSEGAGEARQLQAITNNGLTLARYNRITDLITTYQSLMNEVAYRTGQLKRQPAEG